MSVNSSPGMSTDIWGPWFWALIHDVGVICDQCWAHWTPKQQTQALRFFLVLKDILPCKWCRQSYTQFYHEDPPTYPFLHWIFLTHNKVNTKLERSMHLEWTKFQRRAHVYTAFGSATGLWDLIFILVLNYNPQKKYRIYQQWFNTLHFFIPLLGQYRQYDTVILQPLLKKLPLRSKAKLLQTLSRARKRSVPEVLAQYGEAIAYQNPEEIEQVCGPLVKACSRHEKQSCVW